MSNFQDELAVCVEDCHGTFANVNVSLTQPSGDPEDFDAAAGTVGGTSMSTPAAVAAIRSERRLMPGPGMTQVEEWEYRIKLADLTWAPAAGVVVTEEGNAAGDAAYAVDREAMDTVVVLRCRSQRRAQ